MTEEIMSKRVSIVLPDDVGEIFEEMAKEERRSHSQMGAILLEEAVQARQAKLQPAPTSNSAKSIGGKATGNKGGEAK